MRYVLDTKTYNVHPHYETLGEKNPIEKNYTNEAPMKLLSRPEELVMLAIWHLKDNAYVVTIRQFLPIGCWRLRLSMACRPTKLPPG